jgi:hypothetical protein
MILVSFKLKDKQSQLLELGNRQEIFQTRWIHLSISRFIHFNFLICFRTSSRIWFLLISSSTEWHWMPHTISTQLRRLIPYPRNYAASYHIHATTPPHTISTQLRTTPYTVSHKKAENRQLRRIPYVDHPVFLIYNWNTGNFQMTSWGIP